MTESNQWDDILAERLKEDASPTMRSASDTSFLSSLAAGNVPKAPRPAAPEGWSVPDDSGRAQGGSSPEMVVRELSQRLSPREETRAIEILTGRAGSGSGAGLALVAIMVMVVAGAASFLWAKSLQDRGGLILAADDAPLIEEIRDEASARPFRSSAVGPPSRPEAALVAPEETRPASSVRRMAPGVPALEQTDGPVFSISRAGTAAPVEATPDAQSVVAALAGPAFEQRE